MSHAENVEPVNVYERMARIQDALYDLDKASSLATIGACGMQSGAERDYEHLFGVVDDLICAARKTIEGLAEEVREAVGPPPPDPQSEAFREGVRKVTEKVYGKRTKAGKKGGAR